LLKRKKKVQQKYHNHINQLLHQCTVLLNQFGRNDQPSTKIITMILNLPDLLSGLLVHGHLLPVFRVMFEQWIKKWRSRLLPSIICLTPHVVCSESFVPEK
jgi:hypothetical protein